MAKIARQGSMKNSEHSNKVKFNQFLLLSIFLFTLFSGAVRKWVTNNENINNIVTAIQIVILYALVFLKGKSLLSNSNLSGIFFIYLLYLIVAAFNPASPSFYHAIAGLIIHLSFWLGLFIYLTNKETVNTNRFLYLILTLILIEATLAVLQYQLPRENAVNQYAMQEEFDEEMALNIAMVGDAVRVSGTFSYISGYAAFVLFTQFFSFSLFYNRKIKQYIPILGLILSLMLSFLSGSRSSTLLNIILTLAFVTFQLKQYNYKRIMPGLIGIPIFIISYLSLGDPLNIVEFVSSSYDNFNSRFEENKEEGQGRISTPFLTVINNDFPNKLFGNGLGISYPAIVAVKGTSKVAETYNVQDDEIGRTLLEGGYILLLLKLTLIVFTIKNLTIDKRFMGISFIIIFIYMPLTTNIYNIVFFFMGIIYLEQAILKYTKYENLSK